MSVISTPIALGCRVRRLHHRTAWDMPSCIGKSKLVKPVRADSGCLPIHGHCPFRAMPGHSRLERFATGAICVRGEIRDLLTLQSSMTSVSHSARRGKPT